MSKGDWIRHPAIGVAAFALLSTVTVSIQQVKDKRQSQHPAEYSEQVSINLVTVSDATSPSPADPANTETNKETNKNPDNRANQPSKLLRWIEEFLKTWGDLIAQVVMAFGTLGILYFTGRGLIFVRRTYEASKRTLLHSGRAATAARKQIEEARRIGEIQTRAHISVYYAEMQINEGNGKFHILLKVKNTGNSPASFVRMSSSIGVLNKDDCIQNTWTITRETYDIAAGQETNFNLNINQTEQLFSPRAFWRGEIYITVGGFFEFIDVFGRRQEAPFIFRGDQVDVDTPTEPFPLKVPDRGDFKEDDKTQ